MYWYITYNICYTQKEEDPANTHTPEPIQELQRTVSSIQSMMEKNVHEVSESHQRLEHSLSQVKVTVQELHSSRNEVKEHFNEVRETQLHIQELKQTVSSIQSMMENVHKISESHQRLEHSLSQVNVTLQKSHSSFQNEVKQHFIEVRETQERLVRMVEKEKEEIDGRQTERDEQLVLLRETINNKVQSLSDSIEQLKVEVSLLKMDVQTKFESLVITKETTMMVQKKGELRKEQEQI